MRLYQQILLVVGLTVGMIAAGVAWERFYVSPLVEQAQRKPDPPDAAVDDLPAECLEELSTMGPPSTATGPRLVKPLAAAKPAPSEPLPTAGDHVLRSGSGRTSWRCTSKLWATRQARRRTSVMRRLVRSSKRSRQTGWNRRPRRPIHAPGVGPRGGFAGLRRGIDAAERHARGTEVRRRARSDAAVARKMATNPPRPAASWRGGISAKSIWNLPGSFSVPTWKSASSLPGRCRGCRAWTRHNGCCGLRWIRSRKCGWWPCRRWRRPAIRPCWIVSRPCAQRPRSADSGLGQPDRQAAGNGLQTRRLDGVGWRCGLYAVSRKFPEAHAPSSPLPLIHALDKRRH